MLLYIGFHNKDNVLNDIKCLYNINMFSWTRHVKFLGLDVLHMLSLSKVIVNMI
jgi:hypothetical protein